MSLSKAAQANIQKTLEEIRQAEKSQSQNTTRQWGHREGYKYLAVYKNTTLLRTKVRQFTTTLPRSEYRLKAQLDDAARSVKRNIEEGYKRPTTQEYLKFLGYSQGSLEEVKGDLRDCLSDGFLDKAGWEGFLELINKTDYLFRRLIKSLEAKISNEPGGYRSLQKLRKGH